MKATLTTLLLMLCVLLGAVRPANAAWVTIYIEGVVDYVEDEGNYLEGQIDVGDPITGYYTYDTATPDSSPLEPVQGNYWHYESPARVQLDLGGVIFGSSLSVPEIHIFVRNDTSYGDDVYGFASLTNAPLLTGTAIDGMVWQLTDPTGTALDSDALPPDPPDLSRWDGTYGLWVWGDRMYKIEGHITSAVPEPVTVLFLLFGSIFSTLCPKKR